VNNWITNRLRIEVFYTSDPDMPPLITGISGAIRSGEVDAIEQDLAAEALEGDLFSQGAGSYYIRCQHNRAQTDSYGRVEMPAHWEFDRVGFQAGNEPTERTVGSAPESAR
jgi:hypothetical protein